MPAIVLSITVDDKGTIQAVQKLGTTVQQTGQQINQGTTQSFDRARDASGRFVKGLGEVEHGSQRAGQSASQLSGHGRHLELSFASAAKAMLIAGAAFAGFQGVAGLVNAVTGSVVSFDKELRNLDTVLIGSNLSLKEIEQQILRLPPSLGSATELTKGMYQALSAGVPAAQAVGFVGEQAKLASAGLTDLSTTVKVSTAAMDAFGLTAEQASHISDVLFTVVQRGKTEFGPLAQSIANVFPLAKNLGISFEETAATVTTLTKVFPTVGEAVTGFRSILSGVVANLDNFRAAGINVQDVISKRGLTGLMEELARVTGQSAEVLRAKFIPDIEGTTGALGLMGPQLQAQKENVQAFGNTLGASAGAFEKQELSISKGMDRIKFAIERVVLGSGLAPYFMSLLAPVEAWVTKLAEGGNASLQFAQLATTAIGSVASSFGLVIQGSVAVLEGWQRLGQGVGTVATLYFDALTEITKATRSLGLISAEVAEQSLLNLAKQSLPFREFTISMGSAADQWQKTRESIAAGQAAIAATLAAAEQQALTFAGTLGTVGQTGQQMGTQVAGGAKAAETAVASSQANIEATVERTVAGTLTFWRKGELQTREVFGQMAASGEASAGKTGEAFSKAGISTRAALQTMATEALGRFKLILDSGEAVPQAILEEWQKNIKLINDAGFKTLPPGFQELWARVQDIFRKAGVELPKPILDAFGNIIIAAKKMSADLGVIDAITEKIAQFGANVRNHLSPELLRAGEAMGLLGERTETTTRSIDQMAASTAALSDSARMAGHSINELGQEVNAYGNAVVTTTTAHQKLIDLQISQSETWATDLVGLRKQLTRAINELASIRPDAFLPGVFQHNRKALLEEIALLQEKIAALEQVAVLQGTPAVGPGAAAAPTGTSGSLGAQSGGKSALLGGGGFQAAGIAMPPAQASAAFLSEWVQEMQARINAALQDGRQADLQQYQKAMAIVLGAQSGGTLPAPGATPGLMPLNPSASIITDRPAFGQMLSPALVAAMATQLWTPALAASFGVAFQEFVGGASPGASSTTASGGTPPRIAVGAPPVRPAGGGGFTIGGVLSPPNLTSGAGFTGGTIGGGTTRRFARGGLVTGGSGEDSVPALLSSGERVLTRQQNAAWEGGGRGEIHIHVHSSVLTREGVNELRPMIREVLIDLRRKGDMP